MGIDLNIGYVDGTKIEANANKNTFVYKKRITNQLPKLNKKIKECTHQINQTFGYDYLEMEKYSSLYVFFICQYLLAQITSQNIEIQYGKV